MIENTSADATRDSYKRSAKPLTLKMGRRFPSISTPPCFRRPLCEMEAGKETECT